MDIMSNPMVMDLTSEAGFSLALNEVRRLKNGGCCVLALCCESFSVMCCPYCCGMHTLAQAYVTHSGFSSDCLGCEPQVPSGFWEIDYLSSGEPWILLCGPRKPVAMQIDASAIGGVHERSSVFIRATR